MRFIKVYKRFVVYCFNDRLSLNQYLMMLLNTDLLYKVISHGEFEEALLTARTSKMGVKPSIVRADVKAYEFVLFINIHNNKNRVKVNFLQNEKMAEYTERARLKKLALKK